MKTKGFTLVEAVLTLTLLAGGIVGVLFLFQQNVSKANQMENSLVASFLAQEKMEQIVQDKKYQLYNFIVAANYPSPENLAPQGFPGYTRTTTILEVSPNDLSSQQPGSGYKRVTVAVAISGGETIALTTLLTYWGEP